VSGLGKRLKEGRSFVWLEPSTVFVGLMSLGVSPVNRRKEVLAMPYVLTLQDVNEADDEPLEAFCSTLSIAWCCNGS
jgi:hypothetical protein